MIACVFTHAGLCTPIVTHIADVASPLYEKLRDVALEDSRPIDERFTALLLSFIYQW